MIQNTNFASVCVTCQDSKIDINVTIAQALKPKFRMSNKRRNYFRRNQLQDESMHFTGGFGTIPIPINLTFVNPLSDIIDIIRFTVTGPLKNTFDDNTLIRFALLK